MASSVTHDYPKALVSLMLPKKKVKAVQQAAEAMLPLVKLPEVRQFLNHPAVKPADKKEFLTKLIPTDAPQEFINFIHLITDRRYAQLLVEMLDATIDLAQKAQGNEVVTVITANEITAEQEVMICKDLEKKWSTRIFLKKRVNPNILGGMIVQREDRLYDGSVLGQIKQLRRKLTEDSVL